jgi:hypothetical protein
MTRIHDIPGDGRDNPPYPQPARPGTDNLDHLNIAKGTRIRVLKDNGRRGLVGLEGSVVQSLPGFVIVELENDPLLRHRANMAGGFERRQTAPRRHFRVTEVERVV